MKAGSCTQRPRAGRATQCIADDIADEQDMNDYNRSQGKRDGYRGVVIAQVNQSKGSQSVSMVRISDKAERNVIHCWMVPAGSKRQHNKSSNTYTAFAPTGRFTHDRVKMYIKGTQQCVDEARLLGKAKFALIPVLLQRE